MKYGHSGGLLTKSGVQRGSVEIEARVKASATPLVRTSQPGLIDHFRTTPTTRPTDHGRLNDPPHRRPDALVCVERPQPDVQHQPEVISKTVQTMHIMINRCFTQTSFFSEITQKSRCLVIERKRLPRAGGSNPAIQRQPQHLPHRIPCLFGDLGPGCRHRTLRSVGGERGCCPFSRTPFPAWGILRRSAPMAPAREFQLTKSITSTENQTSQRRFAPMVIVLDENADRFR